MPQQDIQDTLRRSLRQEGLYCLMTHSVAELLAPISNLLQRDSLLVIQNTQPSFASNFQGREADQLHLILRLHADTTYFFNNARAAGKLRIRGLLKDLKRLPLGRRQQICIVLEEHCFARSSDVELRRDLSAWKKFCADNEHTVLFLIHGQYETLWPSLKNCNAVLMSLASLTRNNDTSYCVDIDFWHLPDNLIANEEWLLRSDTDSFVISSAEKVVKHHIEILKNTSDADTIYTLEDIQRDLYPQPHVVADKTSNQQLLDSLQENINAATVILRCLDTSEIDDLATQIYQLRCRAGERLKIAVREAERCLRSADEAYLLHAGCNLIIPYNVKGAKVRNMVASLQGMVFKRPLPPSLSKLCEMRPYSSFHGYCKPQDFVRYAQRAFDNARYNELTHLLIQLKPLEGISMEQTLGLCRLRREGDLLTVADNMVYLFLYACSLDDLDTALYNALDLPVNDIFSGRQVFYQAPAINSELKKISVAESVIDTARARSLLENHDPNREVSKRKARQHYHFARRLVLDRDNQHP